VIISNATLRDRPGTWNVHIDDGKFSSIVASSADAGTDAPDSQSDSFDAAARLVVEPFVDAHVHLDYANTGGRPRPNTSGTFVEAAQIWDERKTEGLNTVDELYRSALAAARSEAVNGTGFIRSHVDVCDPDLTGLQALLQLRADISDWMEIQVVAFPQDTVLSFPVGPKLLEQALEMGADVIGGIPHAEATREDGVASLETIFDLAAKYGVGIDVHCDETDDDQSRFVEVMAALASQRGLGVPIVASHAVAMAYYNNFYFAKLLTELVAARLNFAICPVENLHLQGRGMTPAPRGVAPIDRLVDSGLNVAFGQDSIADSFYPLGEGKLLRILDAGLLVSHMLTQHRLDRALDFITCNGARNLGIVDRYGIEEGKPANCIVLDCSTDTEAVRYQPEVLCSVHNGKIVFTREPAVCTATMDGFATN
jgi:cytosine/adenosine deaminase-related metal-dependent hydrolase